MPRFLNEYGKFYNGEFVGTEKVKEVKEVKEEEMIVEDLSLDEDTTEALEKMTVAQLKKLAKDASLEYPKNVKKGELIDLLEEHDMDEEI